MASIKKLAILLPIIGFGIIAGPPFQSSSASQEAVQIQKPLQHEVSVTLKLIQVYVTDKKGKPVQDLQKSDFIVYDNGQKKEITEFEKHVLAPPTPKVPPQPAEEKIIPTTLPPADKVTVMARKFFLFFDFAFNNQKGVNKAREAALHFIDTELSLGDQVGLLSYSMLKGISIHEYLTTNHRKVREAVEVINAKDIAGRAEDIEEEYWRRVEEGGQNVYQKSFSQLNAERQESKNQVQNFFIKMTALAKALRYVPGQKNLILFSTGIPSSLVYGNRMTPMMTGSRGSIQFIYNAGDNFLITQNEEMLKELSAANCTVFTFDTREASLVPSIFTYDQQTFEEHSRALFTGAGVGQRVNTFKDDNITGWYSISRISSSTGGKYFSNIHEYEKNLDQVQTMTGTYYVLGYYISDRKDGSFHGIKVEVNKKGYEVRAQTGYFNPKPFREYSNLEKELHLFDLALTERPLLQIPLRFSMAPLSYAAGEETRLEILSKIPEAVIQKFSCKKVELVTVVFDEKENLAGLQRGEADLTKYRGMDVFYTSGASLGPGQYKCRLVIRDLDTGDAAVASASARVTQKPSVGLSLHSLLLLVQASNFAYLEGTGAKKEEAISWKEVYPYDRAQYSPVIGEAPKGAVKLYGVVPCSFKGIFLPNITLMAYFINSSSGEKIPFTLTILNKFRKADVEIQFVEFSLTNIPPGKYLLYLHAEENGTKFVSYAQIPLTIK
jgi:VWFA-related protein